MKLTFPNGQEVDVIFDEAAHSYAVAHKLADGSMSDYRPTHGITAPLSVVPKEFLKPWAAKLGVEALLECFHGQPHIVEQLGQFFIDKAAYETNERTPEDRPVMSYYKFTKLYPWFAEAKSAYKRKSREGADLGTWLHENAQKFYASGRKDVPQTDAETQGMWDSFIMFDNFFKPTPDEDGLEFLVYSLMFGYSGQGDFRGTMNGKRCIGDWKTTNRSAQNGAGISTEYFFQLGGLAQAEFERTGQWVDDVFIANFDKKGEEPRVIWASDFGMSPQDCARAYINCFNTYHMIETWDYKFRKR